MKKVQTQIKAIAKNLSTLATKLEKLNSQLETKPAKKAPAKKKAAAKPKKKAAPKAKTTKAKKSATKKTKAAASKGTVLENVLDVISKSRNGANIATLKSKTKLESRQLSNALYKLSKKGLIKTVKRGVYVKA